MIFIESITFDIINESIFLETLVGINEIIFDNFIIYMMKE